MPVTPTGTPILISALATSVANLITALSYAGVNIGTANATPTDTGVTDTFNNALAGRVKDTGDTITGALSLTGSGTGLAVTNNATIGGTLVVTGNATVNGGNLLFAPAGSAAVLDPGSKNLLFKAGSGGTTGLVQSLAPVQVPTINMAPAGVVSNSSQATIRSNAAYSGSQTSGETAFHFIGAASDTVSNTGFAGVSALLVNHNFGGALADGPRNTLDVASNFTTLSGTTDPLGMGFTAHRVTANLMASDGGTSLAPRGTAFAANFVAHAAPQATFSLGLIGCEFDVWAEAGSNFKSVFGVTITQLDGHQVHGTRDDIGLSLNNQGNAIGWNVGIGIGAAQGFAPISSTGTVMAAVPRLSTPTDAGTVAGVFDFSLMTATSFFIKGPASSFLVDGSGNTTATSYKVGANKVVGARDTGWTAMTGTPDKVTAYATSSVTLAQLAGRVAELQAILTAHGLIGA